MNTILSLGVILLAGLAAEKLIGRLGIPAITSYIVLGVLIGPVALDITAPAVVGTSELMSHIVLGFIAFHIGSNFEVKHFREIGKTVLVVSVFETCFAWAAVTAGVHLVADQPFHIALVYGAVAAATAPAATMMVIRQYKAKGRFTDVLLGIVAIDDAWGILVFSISLFIAMNAYMGNSDMGATDVITRVGGDILLSLVIGALAALLVYRIGKYVRKRGDTLTFTLGALLLSTGAARYADVSPLLTNIFYGAVLVNIDKSAYRYFDFLKTVDWPLYIIFYVLVGVNLEMELLSSLGLTAVVYFVFRIIGKSVGAFIGGTASGADKGVRNYMGLALMPQAGVALGLALSARAKFPEAGAAMFTAITVSTIFYELMGPLAARFALKRAGDIKVG